MSGTQPMNMQTKLGSSLLKSLIQLREQKGSILIEDVGAILQNVAESLHPAASQADQFLRQEIAKMAQYITDARQEIYSLIPPTEQNGKPVPSAAEQLDVVIKATEEAAGTVMDTAEEMQTIAKKLGNTPEAQKLTELSNRLFDACSFQDLTGQRVTKVMRSFGEIEERIAKLVQLFGAVPSDFGGPRSNGSKPTREDAHLLNGPQMPGEAPDQAAIDALFEGLKN